MSSSLTKKFPQLFFYLLILSLKAPSMTSFYLQFFTKFSPINTFSLPSHSLSKAFIDNFILSLIFHQIPSNFLEFLLFSLPLPQISLHSSFATPNFHLHVGMIYYVILCPYLLSFSSYNNVIFRIFTCSIYFCR